MLRDEINSALKSAMKARDERQVSALRLVSAAVKNADIEAQLRGRHAPGDDELLALLQRLIKQRQESAEIYDKAARKELAERERGEIAVISAFLPQQLSEPEVKAVITEIVERVGARSIKDMGKVMAPLKQDYAGRMDFGKAGALVKAMLAG